MSSGVALLTSYRVCVGGSKEVGTRLQMSSFYHSIANNRIEVAFNMTHNIKNLLQIKGMERVTVSVNQELNQEMARATAARTWTLRSSEWLGNYTRPSPASMKSLRDHRIK